MAAFDKFVDHLKKTNPPKRDSALAHQSMWWSTVLSTQIKNIPDVIASDRTINLYPDRVGLATSRANIDMDSLHKGGIEDGDFIDLDFLAAIMVQRKEDLRNQKRLTSENGAIYYQCDPTIQLAYYLLWDAKWWEPAALRVKYKETIIIWEKDTGYHYDIDDKRLISFGTNRDVVRDWLIGYYSVKFIHP